MHLWTVTFQTVSALPEDYIVNTWHFRHEGVLPVTDYDNVRDMLEDFYTVQATGASAAITDWYSDEVFTGTATVRAYDLDDTPPRIPVYEDGFTFTPTTDATLPSEVALVLSYQGDPVSGVKQAWKRNRVYLGPFYASPTSNYRPASSFRTSICAAAEEMLAASSASVRWTWCTYSPSTLIESVVTNGWVDDSWDTQRRRGPAPTTRTLFS